MTKYWRCALLGALLGIPSAASGGVISPWATSRDMQGATATVVWADNWVTTGTFDAGGVMFVPGEFWLGVSFAGPPGLDDTAYDPWNLENLRLSQIRFLLINLAGSHSVFDNGHTPSTLLSGPEVHPLRCLANPLNSGDGCEFVGDTNSAVLGSQKFGNYLAPDLFVMQAIFFQDLGQYKEAAWYDDTDLTNEVVPAVPEPSSSLLVGGSCLLLAAFRRRRLGRTGGSFESVHSE